MGGDSGGGDKSGVHGRRWGKGGVAGVKQGRGRGGSRRRAVHASPESLCPGVFWSSAQAALRRTCAPAPQISGSPLGFPPGL